MLGAPAYQDMAGLSSSNGGLGSMIQMIEQSQRSAAGETEHYEDFFVAYVNENARAQQPSSLFLMPSAQQQVRSPVF